MTVADGIMIVSPAGVSIVTEPRVDRADRSLVIVDRDLVTERERALELQQDARHEVLQDVLEGEGERDSGDAECAEHRPDGDPELRPTSTRSRR